MLWKMSGHSKWSQIKRQKGSADQKRGVVFSKLANLITLAAKRGTDPNSNFALRIAIEKARGANMPKENIERAIARGNKTADGNQLEEVLFEIYGPGGVAMLAEGVTDNHNRTLGEVRAALNKFGGKLANAGAVSYLFARKGLLVLPSTLETIDNLAFRAIEAGAEDIQPEDDKLLVITDPTELETVRQNLLNQDITIEEAT